jgi:hypothetical protein
VPAHFGRSPPHLSASCAPARLAAPAAPPRGDPAHARPAAERGAPVGTRRRAPAPAARARRAVPDPSSRGLRGCPPPPGARRAAPAWAPFTVPPAPVLDVIASPWQVAPRPAVADHPTNGTCPFTLLYHLLLPAPAAAAAAGRQGPTPPLAAGRAPRARPERAPLSRSVPHPRPLAPASPEQPAPAAPAFFPQPPASKPSPHNTNTPQSLAWVSPFSLLSSPFQARPVLGAFARESTAPGAHCRGGFEQGALTGAALHTSTGVSRLTLLWRPLRCPEARKAAGEPATAPARAHTPVRAAPAYLEALAPPAAGPAAVATAAGAAVGVRENINGARHKLPYCPARSPPAPGPCSPQLGSSPANRNAPHPRPLVARAPAPAAARHAQGRPALAPCAPFVCPNCRPPPLSPRGRPPSLSKQPSTPVL